MTMALENRRLLDSGEVPPAFLCSVTKEIMREPVMAMCGHLFERAVTLRMQNCPQDGSSLDQRNLLSFSELQRIIGVWQTDRQSRLPKSYRCAAGAAASVNVSDPLDEVTRQTDAISIREPFRPSHLIQNAHRDDIHGLILHQRGFVSGSKDSQLKIWDTTTKRFELLRSSHRIQGNVYESWITSINRLSQGLWASGTRDRHVSIWRDNQEIATHTYEAQYQAICKQRNEQRVLCVTELGNDSNSLQCYVGSPQEIQLIQFSLSDRSAQSRRLASYVASSNDWVYCMELIGERNLLVVIGTDLEHWDMSAEQPVKNSIVHVERVPGARHQRPFISAIKRLEGNVNCLATAIFGGMVDLIDLTTNARIKRYHAHRERVWAIENIRENVIASCSDDKTIQLYDVRQDRPFFSFVGGAGRVSNLLRLSADSLISASCPDQVSKSAEKASIAFWDIRRLPID